MKQLIETLEGNKARLEKQIKIMQEDFQKETLNHINDMCFETNAINSLIRIRELRERVSTIEDTLFLLKAKQKS